MVTEDGWQSPHPLTPSRKGRGEFGFWQGGAVYLRPTFLHVAKARRQDTPITTALFRHFTLKLPLPSREGAGGWGKQSPDTAA
jgi:hypothetical protein